jgi:hypothetical protein
MNFEINGDRNFTTSITGENGGYEPVICSVKYEVFLQGV